MGYPWMSTDLCLVVPWGRRNGMDGAVGISKIRLRFAGHKPGLAHLSSSIRRHYHRLSVVCGIIVLRSVDFF
jgi:hypothetical protein